MTEASLPSASRRPRALGPPQFDLRHPLCARRKPGHRIVAFGLFVSSLLCALFGPYIVPYDPLASDTSAALQPPSLAHWFGTDQLGRDIFSRVVVATRLDFHRGRLGGAGVPDGRPRRHRRRLFRRLDRPHRRPHRRHHHGVSAVRAGDGHRRGARQHRQNIVIATAIINFPLYVRVARAEANVRRDAGFVQAARGCPATANFGLLLVHILPNIMPIMMVQMSLTMGYAILNAAGLSFIGLGVKPPTPEWGIMVAEGATFMVSGEWWIAFFPGSR
jgi:peptide/nickel transport system permease protein